MKSKKLTLLFLLMLTLSQIGYTQGYLHQKRSKIKANFSKYCERDSLLYNINDTDSLVLSVKDPSVLPIDIVCYFKKNGRCIEQITKLCCDSCSDKMVRSWMHSKRIHWHMIDSTHYISGMGKNLLFTLIDSKTFSVKYLRPKEYMPQREKYKEAKRNSEE
ncbi:MAG: hypothetical protein QM737_01135 [Ferruginibacter sp.]